MGPFHSPVAAGDAVAGMLGNPVYDMSAEHGLAVAAVALLPVAGWLMRASGSPRATALAAGYDLLPPLHRFGFWLLAVSAAAHLGLAVGHGEPGLRVLFVVDAVLLAVAARRLALGRPWRLLAGVLLGGSLVAYWLAVVGGEAPDEVGLATKLVEITALAIVLRPTDAGRLRGWFASGATIGIVVLTGLTAWIGAFGVAGGAGAHVHDHGAGTVPGPGTLIRATTAHAPTPAETRAADELYAATVAALAGYADPSAAAAAGYDVDGISGLDFHASNPTFEHDDEVLDPDHPETLVYALGPSGPVLLGAMFQMPTIGEPGPSVGGSLTTWHGHEQICVSLLPPGLTGIVSPLGGCPVGSVAVPRTVEMMHVWTVPGAPQRFGDLDDAWRRAYVAGVASREATPRR